MSTRERSGYRVLLDATMRFVRNGEDYEAELHKLPPSDVRDALLKSTKEHLLELREQADDLARRGLGSDKV